MVTSSGANSTTPGVSAPIPFIDNGLTRIAGYSQLTLYDAKNNASIPITIEMDGYSYLL